MGINLLLLKRSFSTGWKRMALIASSVAIGVLILLSFTAMFNAFTNEDRLVWQSAIQSKTSANHKPVAGVDPIYAITNSDSLNGISYSVIDMQASGSNISDFAPGYRMPRPGEYYVSPELARLMKEQPALHLEKRYGDKLIGTLPASILPGQDSLMVVRGSNYPIENGEIILSRADSASPITVLTADVANYSFITRNETRKQSGAYKVMMAVTYLGIVILLFPVVMLISIATRLGSVQRERRYAALRLVGVTNGQVTGIIATESAISTIIGIAAGFGLYLLIHPLLYHISLSDYLYWSDDIRVTMTQGLAIAGITLIMSLIANWWGMRSVRTSPLGVSQRQKVEKKPGWWRLLLPVAGMGLFVFLSLQKYENYDQIAQATNLMMLGVVIVMVGLVLVAPLLTYRLSQLVAKLARRPTVILGMKYIQVHARDISRSVSGVVLALFAGSFYLIGTSGIKALEVASVKADGLSIMRDGAVLVQPYDQVLAQRLGNDLANHASDVKMITKFAQVHSWGDFISGSCLALNDYFAGLDCSHAKLAAVAGSVPAGDPNQIVYADSIDRLKSKMIEALMKNKGWDRQFAASSVIDNGDAYLVSVKDDDYEALVSTLLSYTGGVSADGIRIKSSKEAKTPFINPVIDRLGNLAYAGMAVTMAVAIASITISTIGGLLERRRSLYTLRLGGMQVSELKQMVMIESVIPLVAMSALSVGLGAWCSVIAITVGSSSLKPQVTPLYLVIVVGSLVIAALAIYLILPMINRLTSPSDNQTE